jgi:hypothetical protein
MCNPRPTWGVCCHRCANHSCQCCVSALISAPRTIHYCGWRPPWVAVMSRQPARCWPNSSKRNLYGRKRRRLCAIFPAYRHEHFRHARRPSPVINERLQTAREPLSDEVIVNPMAGYAFIAVSPDNTRLYVAEAGINAVAVLDTSNPVGPRLLGRIPTDRYPTALAISSDGKTLYIVNAKGVGENINPNTNTSTPYPPPPPTGLVSTLRWTATTFSAPSRKWT